MGVLPPPSGSLLLGAPAQLNFSHQSHGHARVVDGQGSLRVIRVAQSAIVLGARYGGVGVEFEEQEQLNGHGVNTHRQPQEFLELYASFFDRRCSIQDALRGKIKHFQVAAVCLHVGKKL